ncbi:hypothetical protein C8T65DRAFT_698830 [Cerioporus squamosus]|nr:hypothetical protein C8T65DRAFT_698830 [Cerioporus squamosus]
MSSGAESAAAAVVARFQNLYGSTYTDTYCQTAVTVLLLYEGLITFDREVACFWNAKPTGASLLYFANKWTAILVNFFAMVGFAPFHSEKVATFALQVLQFVPGAVFSTLRAFVLSRSKLLGLLVLALSLVPVGANLVRYDYDISGEVIPSFGCFDEDNTTAEFGLRVLFILNALHLTLSLTSLEIDDDGASYVTNFTGPLTAILVSRFLLNLQEANQADLRVDPDDPLHYSNSRSLYDTSGFISSLGAFINPDSLSASSEGDFELADDSPSNGEERRAQIRSWQAAGPSQSQSSAT